MKRRTDIFEVQEEIGKYKNEKRIAGSTEQFTDLSNED
jgi:hypothetical protein